MDNFSVELHCRIGPQNIWCAIHIDWQQIFSLLRSLCNAPLRITAVVVNEHTFMESETTVGNGVTDIFIV